MRLSQEKYRTSARAFRSPFAMYEFSASFWLPRRIGRQTPLSRTQRSGRSACADCALQCGRDHAARGVRSRGARMAPAGTPTYADRTGPRPVASRVPGRSGIGASVGLRRIDISPTLCTGRRGGKLIVDGLRAVRMPHLSQRTPKEPTLEFGGGGAHVRPEHKFVGARDRSGVAIVIGNAATGTVQGQAFAPAHTSRSIRRQRSAVH